MFILMCFVPHSVFAQIKVTGTVKNQQNEVLENVNVLLLQSKDSSLIKGAISDKGGHYLFQGIAPGNYLISVSYTGFQQAYTSRFSIENKDHFKTLGEIVLSRSATDLKTVTVIARKPLFEQKMDRMIVNVSESITFAGGSALEVLERSPGVMIDHQNSNIIMNGKEGVIVMMNNKINRMPASAVIQMLAGMSANSIEKIELISSPPANFDAEGNAGYINIVLKSNTETGTNGSYTITAGFSRGENTQFSINLNNRKGALNTFGDIAFSRIRTEQVWEIYKKVLYQGKIKESFLDVNRRVLQLLVNGKLGADYTINKNTVLGILVSGYTNRQTRKWNNHSDLLTEHRLDTNLIISTMETNDWSNLSGNINLQHSLSKDEKINLNVNYDYYLSDNPVEYLNEYFGPDNNFLHEHFMRTFKRTPLNIWVAAADYARKLSGKVNMETGLKVTLSTFINDIETNNLIQNSWQKNDAFSSIYNLNENIVAGYVSFSIELNPKISLKSGIRYENTSSNLGSKEKKDEVVRHYGNLFPSLYLTHAFNEQNKLNFSYSRRITRPSFNNLAPTTLFVDPYTYFYGNPALQPAIGNTFAGSYSHRRKILTISFTNELRPITNYVPKIDAATNIQSLSAENQKNTLTLTTGLLVPFNVANWWSGQFNISAIYQQMNAYIKGDETAIKQKYIMAGFSQAFILPKNFSAETSATYNSGGFFGIYIRKPYGASNAGVQKKFPASRSSLRLNAVNILNSQAFNLNADIAEYNLHNTFKMYFTFPAYRLTYTQNFGNDKLKQVRKRSTGAEDAKLRIE